MESNQPTHAAPVGHHSQGAPEGEWGQSPTHSAIGGQHLQSEPAWGRPPEGAYITAEPVTTNQDIGTQTAMPGLQWEIPPTQFQQPPSALLDDGGDMIPIDSLAPEEHQVNQTHTHHDRLIDGANTPSGTWVQQTDGSPQVGQPQWEQLALEPEPVAAQTTGLTHSEGSAELIGLAAGNQHAWNPLPAPQADHPPEQLLDVPSSPRAVYSSEGSTSQIELAPADPHAWNPLPTPQAAHPEGLLLDVPSKPRDVYPPGAFVHPGVEMTAPGGSFEPSGDAPSGGVFHASSDSQGMTPAANLMPAPLVYTNADQVSNEPLPDRQFESNATDILTENATQLAMAPTRGLDAEAESTPGHDPSTESKSWDGRRTDGTDSIADATGSGATAPLKSLDGFRDDAATETQLDEAKSKLTGAVSIAGLTGSSATGSLQGSAGLPDDAAIDVIDPDVESQTAAAIEGQIGQEALSPTDAATTSAPPSPVGIVIDEDAPPRPTLLRLASAERLAERESPKAPGLARQTSTEDLYARRARALFKASEQARSIDEQTPVVVSPTDVVDDLLASASANADGRPAARSFATFKQYRAALLWHLASRRNLNTAYEQAYRKLADSRRPTNGRRKQLTQMEQELYGLPTRAMIPTRKFIPPSDLNALLNALGGRARDGRETAPLCQAWILATIGSGVRVNEWLQTRWANRDTRLLEVPNSKRKSTLPAYTLMKDAANGAMTVHDLPPEDLPAGDLEDSESALRYVTVAKEYAVYVDITLEMLDRMLVEHQSEGIDKEAAFERIYARVRKAICSACKIAFNGKRSYGLYTMRSQFAANAHVDHDLPDVSSLLGHGKGSSTTRTNYAGAKHAHRSHVIQARMGSDNTLSQGQMEAGPLTPNDTAVDMGMPEGS